MQTAVSESLNVRAVTTSPKMQRAPGRARKLSPMMLITVPPCKKNKTISVALNGQTRLNGSSPRPDFFDFGGAREGQVGNLVGLDVAAGGCSEADPGVAFQFTAGEFVDAGQHAA